jgi:hypothetical protein
VNNCEGLEIAGNLFFGTTSLRLANGAADANSEVDANGEGFRNAFPANVYYGAGLGAPQGVAAFVRPNVYESERAHLIIYNWDRLASVLVDLGSLPIRPGDRYEIRNVQDYYGAAITGVYRGGAIEVPMTGWRVELPIGYFAERLPATFPEFGVFVVTWTEAGGLGSSARARSGTGRSKKQTTR